MRREGAEIGCESREKEFPRDLHGVSWKVERPPLARFALRGHLRLERRELAAHHRHGGLNQREEAIVCSFEHRNEARLSYDTLDVIAGDSTRDGALVLLDSLEELFQLACRNLRPPFGALNSR